MRTRTFLGALALGTVALTLALQHASATAGVSVFTCKQAQWCTITASGDVTQTASQLAIGNVSAGTALAVTQDDVKHQQVGGEILGGNLRGICGWSQYGYDWTLKALSVAAACADPVHNTVDFVSANGTAIWSGCYPRCFGGVPLVFDRRCGQRGHNWCYSSNCEEYANFYPWSPSAHPANPIRMTHRHTLDIRYLARYGDVLTETPFYLVRDPAVAHGTGNWVFISGAACVVRAGPPGIYHWLPHPSKPHHSSAGPTAHAAALLSALGTR
jgi:hypothetical protein